MRILYLLIIISAFNLSISAQFGRINNKIANQIVNNETVVILSKDSPEYNKMLKKIIKQYWKITNYTFEFDADIKNNYKNENKNYLWLFHDINKKKYYGNGNYINDCATTTLNVGSLILSKGGKANKQMHAFKNINDVVLFKSDFNQIKLAVNIVQNHIKEGVDGADISSFDLYYYKNKEIKVEKGCVLIFDKDLVECGYSVVDQDFYNELLDMTKYVEEKALKKVTIINPNVFDKEIDNCPYYLERQVQGSGGTFVLYDLKKSEVVNLYSTKNASLMYYKIAWKKAFKKFY